MERHRVIGTAGHIDHGKTALVRALTGVDTDRLAEEKRRGITIDLGFAPLDLGAVRASVVDVPGHEGFVRNMVAGATGVDLALLVVAADEGVMPQTTEHLAILGMLGVRHGVVALTKCDLAPDPAWRELVAEDVHAAVAARFGARWPLVEVSAVTGAGLPDLRAALEAEAAALPERDARDRFRMPVDRTFALAGAGTIVTGTVWSGSVAEGDRVLVLPAGVEARVRSVEVHGARAERAGPGRRAALALVGLSREQAERGAVVVSGDGWRASRVLDVELRMLEGHAAIRPRLRVRVHHATSEVMARIVPGPHRGEGTAARLRLEAPLVARAGDRFVLRSYSPVTTIGGGIVVDPLADELVRERGRRRPQPAPFPDGDRARVALLIDRRGRHGLARATLEVAAGLDAGRLEAALAAAAKDVVREGDWWFTAALVGATVDDLLAALRGHHEAHPLEAGMSVQAWRAAVSAPRAELVEVAERRLESVGGIARDGAMVHMPGWSPGGGARERAATEALLRDLERAGAEPPSVGELAAGHPGTDVPSALRLLAQQGLVVAVGRDRYYARDAFAREQEAVLRVLRELGEASPAVIRERVGRSRKWLIPLLEQLDRDGVTVRRGDVRIPAAGPAS